MVLLAVNIYNGGFIVYHFLLAKKKTKKKWSIVRNRNNFTCKNGNYNDDEASKVGSLMGNSINLKKEIMMVSTTKNRFKYS